MRGWVIAIVLATSSLASAGDPKTECIAAADQAQQARDDGKWRAARDGFVSCSRAECPKMVAASCTKWAREIDDGMPTVVLAAKDASGADLTDVRVTFDGALLATALDGKPIDVDPGAHKFRFSRDGSSPVEQSLVVKAGEKLRSVSVVMRASAVVAHTEPVVPVEPPRDHGPGDGAHIATTVVLGVLGVGALVGGVTLALSSQSDADTAASLRAQMPSNACIGAGATGASCQSLSSAVDAQNRDAAIAITMYVASGVFAAAAILAFVAWPKHKTESASAHLIVGPGAFGIGGTF
ncbi:MAG TPA: hypothetical protein VH054_25895 [Polyangiaceae bacterium]|nr:hypothetical protein [Polyangiaceae bacterium]